MTLSNSDKGVILLIIGFLGFSLIIPMIFYVCYLVNHHLLTWQNFTHIHWIGKAGVLAMMTFLVCATLCIYLTKKDAKMGNQSFLN